MTHLVLLSLCAFRIWRLLGKDDVTMPLRVKVVTKDRIIQEGGFRGWTFKLLTCEWCLGTWVSLALVTWDHFHPIPTWGLLLGAASALVGFLGTLDERLNR